MTAFFTVLLLLAQPAPASLGQLRAESNPEHRARQAIEFAAMSERSAESSYSKGDMAAVKAELQNMEKAVEIARDAFVQTGKTPQRHAGLYKSAELRTEEILVRLGDLEKRMDADERSVVEEPRTKVQQIHDAWFEGIMGKKR
ncbi:MAG: hypothetical protein QOJ99_1160 [Bryobacterales bacterium]|jgi:hypothetical protein|nr:hypothetical protein [Bryobacterales bacterium]